MPGQAIPRASLPTAEAASIVPDTAGNVYWRSVLTGVLNPKVAVFFLAFLPQFVHPERGLVWLQFFVLGVLLSLIGLSHSLVLSFAIGRYGGRFRQGANRWKQRITGTVFIAIGLRLAFQQRA